MRNAKQYYNATMNRQPTGLIMRFFCNKFNERLRGNDAIDLGCGAGSDTEFLISKGFKVTAIDSEEQVKEILENKDIDKTKLSITIGDFSKVEIPNADLIYANMSLFFVKENFDVFMKNLLEKVNKDGFFIANFLGNEDDWAETKTKTTVEKEELLKYFKNFKMYYFSEEKYYKETVLGKNKFWHVYTVIAQLK